MDKENIENKGLGYEEKKADQRRFITPFQSMASKSLLTAQRPVDGVQNGYNSTLFMMRCARNALPTPQTLEKTVKVNEVEVESNMNTSIKQLNPFAKDSLKKTLETELGNSLENKDSNNKTDEFTDFSIKAGDESLENLNKGEEFRAKMPKKSQKSFVNPLTNTVTNIITEKKHNELYYEVIYANKHRKKQNSDDGILVLTICKFVLLDSKGKQISESPNTFKVKSLRNGDTVSMGLREVEIQHKISRKDYISGRCFMQDAPVLDIPDIKSFQSKAIEIPVGAYILDPESKLFIEPFLAQKLRTHQREGVQFMYDSVAGKRVEGYFGCILADSMGLGKTLQAITLLYTLLRKDAPYYSFARKGIIVTPATLVDNWKEELNKWLGPVRLTPIICSGTGKQKKNLLSIFEKGPSSLLIISYDTFVKHSLMLGKICQIIICDEGHLLKNCITQKNTSISTLACRRRILLTGTPLQNYLSEFYACVTLVNPGILGDPASFNKIFTDPILKAQEPNASTQIRELAWGRSEELWRVTAQFILRRTGSILESVLPPRNEYLVFCKFLPLQKELYVALLSCKLAASAIENGNSSNALCLTSLLRKLVNHPDFILSSKPKSLEIQESLELLKKIYPVNYSSHNRKQYSSKFHLLFSLINKCKEAQEKIVVVSSFTKTLDLIQQQCEAEEFSYLRLDGSTIPKKRMKLVNSFNNMPENLVFLLSSKAGGCGLNLIGANRLVLFDPDWNPSNDKQAMGRIWRDGQKKEVHIYRFFLSGSIEEKIYQRQTAKENLSSTIVDAKKGVSKFSKEYIKEIFSISEKTTSIENGDELSMWPGAMMEGEDEMIDVFKKVQAEWEQVKVEKLDFTEAKQENIEGVKDTEDIQKSCKKKKVV